MGLKDKNFLRKEDRGAESWHNRSSAGRWRGEGKGAVVLEAPAAFRAAFNSTFEEESLLATLLIYHFHRPSLPLSLFCPSRLFMLGRDISAGHYSTSATLHATCMQVGLSG